jgi:hypothetical protein
MAELERVVFVITPAGEATLFTTTGPLDVAAVLAATGVKGAAQDRHGHRLHTGGPTAVAFVEKRTFLLGSVDVLEHVLKPTTRPAQMPEAIANALRVVPQCHLVYAARESKPGRGDNALANLIGLEISAISSSHLYARFDGDEREVVLFGIPAISSSHLYARFDRTLELSARVVFTEQAVADQMKQTLERERNLALENLDELGELMAERFVPVGGPRLARDVFAFFLAARPALRDLQVQQKGKELSLELKVPGRGALWGLGMLAMPVTKVVHSDNLHDWPLDKLPPDKLPQPLPAVPPKQP